MKNEYHNIKYIKKWFEVYYIFFIEIIFIEQFVIVGLKEEVPPVAIP